MAAKKHTKDEPSRPQPSPAQGGELFIVDNSDEDWRVLRYLRDWCEIARAMDVATGCFEIGSLLALDGQWQKLDSMRVLMGDETTRRTQRAFEAALDQVIDTLDSSIESEKAANDFLDGVPGIVEALRSGKIACRVYRKNKFHAKAYITHGKLDIVGSAALVGSSNFTGPGLTKNVELNIQIRREVNLLQEWFERHWQEAEEVTPEVLRAIERHVREYSPFEVYAKALQEFFRGHEMTVGEWEIAGPESGGSRMYAVLDQYQKEGYRALMKIAGKGEYGGAFLCDGVGLGKTFIGLMVIERLVIHDRRRVVLFAPKMAVEDVWKPAIKQYMRHIGGDFSNLVIFSHTDVGREGEYPERFKRIKEMADAFVIDEAHHFRNPGVKGLGEKRPSRYRQFYDLIDGPRGTKQLFLLTATPINNRLNDFRHMIELFSRKRDDYFKTSVGVHSLRGHFVKMERELKRIMEANQNNGDEPVETNLAEAERILSADELFRALVVQRSRAYVKESQIRSGAAVTSFPTRAPPRVVGYSAKKTYGRLLEKVEKAFSKDKPLFILSIYYPLAYYVGPDMEKQQRGFLENRQKQVVGLIRTQFLKRFESSAHAFERSCHRLLLKLLAWVTRHAETAPEKRQLEVWRGRNSDLIDYAQAREREACGEDDGEDADEDIVTEEMLEDIEYLAREDYNVPAILGDCYQDLDEIADLLAELHRFEPKHDDKLKGLVRLLKTDKVLKRGKLLLFSEFAETARYLARQLTEAGIEGVGQIDSGTKVDRSEIIRRFAPYYNDSSSGEIAASGRSEIRVLISTDVLSEGLNLQDATRLINYDLHWNPVRLMQRIGRVDRRMNPDVEARLLADHPDQKELRGKVAFWNFLPPGELEELLKLYNRVSHKTLRISKTLGIEGRKLLTPDDDFEALRDFNHTYEGTTSPIEKMRLELQQLFADNPGLEDRLEALPGRVFSGQEHPSEGAKAVFFCYRVPKPNLAVTDGDGGHPWCEETGETHWLLYDLADAKILAEPSEIIEHIRCEPDTPKRCVIERETLVEIRAKMDKHMKNTHLKRLQAPVGVKAILKAWMELN